MARKPTAWQIAKFLAELFREGCLHAADLEILKAHARLGAQGGENWKIVKAASRGVVNQWSRGLSRAVKHKIHPWRQPPSWHAADCLQRWLGHALAERFPYYASQIRPRDDGTKRWWMALGEAVETTDRKCTAVRLRPEIIEALNRLERIS